MVARLFAFALAGASALLLGACGATDEQWPAPSPALWQVTAPSGQQGWLFGTVHALPDGLDWHTPALDTAMDEAGVLIVEIADPGGSGGSEVFVHLAHTPGQPPLLSRVPPEDRAGLAAMLDRQGRSEADFSAIETWAAALMFDSGSGGDPANGVDRALIGEASAVRALETRESQLRLFDELPEADQRALLTAAIGEANSDDPVRAIRAWLIGDMETLDRLANEGVLAHAALRETLLTARNAAWLPPVMAAIERGERPLVAVGAVHMAGDDGLPAMLAARGYRVERVQ